MKLKVWRGENLALGVAIGPERVWTVPLRYDGQRPGESAHVTSAPSELSLEALTAAFGALHESGGRRITAHICLMPPLVMPRSLELPRFPPEECRQYLVRNAARYFPGTQGPTVVGVGFPRGRGSPVRVFASATESTVAQTVLDAAGAAGWEVVALRSAYDCWALAATDRADHNRLLAVVWSGGLVHILGLRDGLPWLVRRLPAGGDVTRIAQAAASVVPVEYDRRGPRECLDAARVALLASEDEIADLTRSLTERLGGHGLEVRAIGEPGAVAAAYAARSAGPELLPESVHRERRGRVRGGTLRLAAAAVLVLFLATGTEIWGVHRELAAARRARETLHRDVEAALRVQEAAGRLEAALGTLEQAERASPRWSWLIADIARELPRDAHLIALHGTPDSISLEGFSTAAARVFSSIGRIPGVSAVQARGPVRRQAGGPGAAVERFSVAAALRSAARAEPPNR